MRLYLFRTTLDIPADGLEKVAERIGQILGIDYSVFSEPVLTTIEQTSMEDLLRISDQFLKRNEPVVAIVFTSEGVEDEAILGQGSQQDRGAWVKWSDNRRQTSIITLHELGHIFEADHCINEHCVMFPTYREHSGSSLDALFCDKCRISLQNSWIYQRLRQAAEDRAKKKQSLPQIVQTASTGVNSSRPIGARQSTPPGRASVASFGPPFPDWSLADTNKEEFLRRVREHFGYRGR